MNSHSLHITTLLSGLILGMVPGCWTSDAHQSDTGTEVDTIAQCGLSSKTTCYGWLTPNAQGDFADLSTNTFLVPGQQYSQINVFPGPDNDAGNPNGLLSGAGSDGIYRITGTVPGSAGWNLSGQLDATHAFKCAKPVGTGALTPIDLTAGAGYDASNFDGIRIALGGDIGTPKVMTFNIDSFGTPEDPYRLQTLTTTIVVPKELTTFHFLWSEFTTTCGRAEYFQPGKITGISASFLPLAGIAYEFELEIGAIGFIPKTH